MTRPTKEVPFMNKNEKQKKRERKPAHKVFLEMIKEFVETMRTENRIFQLQQAQDALYAIFDAVERSIIPEKELPGFVAELQEIAQFYRENGTGKYIEEVVIARLRE